MPACPNKNLDAWKELEERFGSNIAESLYYKNKGNIPSLQEAQTLLRSSKIGQFKEVVRHLQNTTSVDPIDLINKMPRIIQKVGNELYIVKGSKLNETPSIGAEMEIHSPNVKFLQSVNNSIGPLFTLDKVIEESKSKSLGDEIIDSLQNGEFDSIVGFTYKSEASDPIKRDQILKELSEQTKTEAERNGLVETIGQGLVDKIVNYNESLKASKIPAGNRLFSESNPETSILSEAYKAQNNINAPVGSEIYNIDTKYASRIADAFQQMEHNPNDINVKRAYNAMADETVAQYKELEKAGYKIELYKDDKESLENNKKAKFTKFQISEILPLLDIRQGTIDEDPYSADPLEQIPGSLDELKSKIEKGDMNFTKLEKDWLISELETHVEKGFDFSHPDEKMSRLAFIKSMQGAIDKVKSIKEISREPYKNSSEMIDDVRNNKHLYVLSTESDFGQNKITDAQREENPLLKDSGTKDINGNTLLINDVFRGVHDFFGHTERGNSFGPIGEENAWDVHARMYTPEARRAMTTETRGQNSWVNFGPHMRNAEGNLLSKGENGYLDITKRPFAEQKIGLLPEEFSTLPENQGLTRPNSKVAAPGTYKVQVNQDVLNDLAAQNADREAKALPKEQHDTKDQNEKVLDNTAPRYSRAYNEIQVSAVNNNILNYLGRKFNIPYEVVNDPTANWRGKFENGKVFINTDKVTEFTPFHEYLHPFTLAMQKDNPDLYNNLISELQSSESGKKIIDDIKKNYPELGAKDQLDEALVTHLGNLSATGEIKSRPWYQKFIDWLKEKFGKIGIGVSNLDINMSLNDVANKILDPTYRADLQKYDELNNAATKFQKTIDDNGFSENFNQVIDKIRNKLKLDVNVPAKTKEQETRKFFSGKQLADLENNIDAYRALNGYVTSAIINAKGINEKFDQFRTFYENKNGKISKEDAIKGMGILSEMEQHIALYDDARFVVDAVRQENPEEYDDNFKVLRTRLDGDTSIINNYHNYGLKLMSDWIYPTMKNTINNTIKSGNIEKMPGYNEYLAFKAQNPNVDNADAIENGVKTWLKGQMEHATSDIGFFNSFMSGVLNSKDPISQLVALSLKEEFAKNNTRLFKVKTSIENAIKKARGTKLFTNNKQHKEFYSKYLHQVDNWEKVGYNEDGSAKFEYVKRTAFHQPFHYDQYYKAKREFFKELGVRPNKNDEVEYKAWEAKKDSWLNEHSVRIYNDKGEVIKSNPASKYINKEYATISSDPMFKELEKHYNDGNEKLGRYQLKYGIVPQQYADQGLLGGVDLKKGLKENAQELKENLKHSISSDIGSYYAQDINGKEYKNIPIRWTRLVPEDRLSYNLGKSVADFWESSSKFSSAKEIEPMVLTLRNFIEGNASLKLNERTAPEIDAKGVKKLGNYVKNITKTKEEPNINRQLIDFINDEIYGESEKKANIKSPFLNLKYLVYKKDDISANGKPHREYVYSLEDLKKKTGAENIEHSNFEKGTEKDVNGYGVTLIRNDKILSVNKLGRKLNGLSATVTLGINTIAGASHLLRGVASNFIEATGGKYFNNKEWVSGYKEYFKNLVNFSFLEDTKGGKGSKISQLLTHYGTFQGEFLNEFGKHVGQGVVNKLFRRSALFFSIHGAEHMIQTTQMIAAMKHIKMSDGKTSLFDAWEVGKDGYIKIKDGVKWDDSSDNNFKNLVQSINKDRGNYSEFDKSALSRLWWGKMIIMFRRHIFNGIKSRWGASYVDYERGSATEGYYRSFIKALSSEFNEFRLNGKFRKLTPDEAYASKKTLADVGLFAMLAAVIIPKLRDKKQHDTDVDDYLALFARRLQMDVSFFYDPLEWKHVIQNPVVTGSTIDKFYELFHQMATDPSEEYTRYGAGYGPGDNKAGVMIKKLIPGYRTYLNAQSPQDLIKFYDLKKPVGQ